MNGASTEAGASRWAEDQQVMPERAEGAERDHQRRSRARVGGVVHTNGSTGSMATAPTRLE